MSRSHSLERLGALEYAWNQARMAKDQDAPFVIAVSREAGIDSATITHEVGRLLNWPVYDQELLERIAQDMHLRPDLLERVDERSVPWLLERVETFLSAPAVTKTAYVKRLITTLFSLAAHGRCVVVGRGAAHVLPAATTVRVRL